MALFGTLAHFVWAASPFLGVGYTVVSAIATLTPKGSKVHSVLSTVAFDLKAVQGLLGKQD